MTIENYPACMAFTLKQEGGNSDIRGDRGGRTGRGGITHATYDAYRHKKGLPLQDVFKITDNEIAEIYHAEYWFPIGGDDLPVGVDLCIMDISINSGPTRALHILRAVPTKEAAPGDHVRAICAARLAFLKSLRSWGQFGRGWSRRVAECEAAALLMVSGVNPTSKAHVDTRKAAKVAKAHNTNAVGGVVLGGVVAGLHWLGGMPDHMALAAGGIVSLVVVYSLYEAQRVARKALNGHIIPDMPTTVPPQVRPVEPPSSVVVSFEWVWYEKEEMWIWGPKPTSPRPTAPPPPIPAPPPPPPPEPTVLMTSDIPDIAKAIRDLLNAEFTAEKTGTAK
jgi:lysozyme family protein